MAKKTTVKTSKQVRKPVVETHESYFVSIKSPLELRRQILESSKKSIYCLQNYQRLLVIRGKKADELQKLRESMKELIYLDKKLNDRLPHYDHALLHKPKEAVPKIVQKKQASPVAMKKVQEKSPKSDLEKLEQSLASIESRLRNLGN